MIGKTLRSSMHGSMKGTGRHDVSVNVGFVGDREVSQTLAATSTTRFVKDKYYLIVDKTIDSSEAMRTK